MRVKLYMHIKVLNTFHLTDKEGDYLDSQADN